MTADKSSRLGLKGNAMRWVAGALGLASIVGMGAGLARPAAAEEAVALPKVKWSFDGPFGKFDQKQLRRGLEVYTGVCAACHGLDHLSYRDLEGIGLSEDEIKALAAKYQVGDGPNDAGDMYQRPARPSDPVASPFANEQQARAANNGAYPPDQSTIVKARMGGADYVNAILTGFKDAPAGFELLPGQYYNEYFAGRRIGMPPPLADGMVDYSDGAKATLDQESQDVTAFLAWAAEPEMEARKRLGIKVILFLVVLTGILVALKRRVWSDLH